MFSLLKFEKDTYHQLEHPKIDRIIPKEVILNHPGREKQEYRKFHDGFIEILFAQMPTIEKNMENHPFKEILIPELMRFKASIHYDDLLLKAKEAQPKNYK